ncbi:hypothetical protein IGL98_000114 [Enterococcus sp. DIV0840]
MNKSDTNGLCQILLNVCFPKTFVLGEGKNDPFYIKLVSSQKRFCTVAARSLFLIYMYVTDQYLQ